MFFLVLITTHWSAANETASQAVIDWLSQWRNRLDGWEVDYRVKIDSFNVPNRDDEGVIDSSKPLISRIEQTALVRLVLSKSGIFERITPQTIIKDGVEQPKSDHNFGVVEFLAKDESSTLFYPTDNYVWIKQGSSFDVPYIANNFDKTILLSGLCEDLLIEALSAEWVPKEEAFKVKTPTAEMSISVEDSRPKAIVIKYQGQEINLRYTYEGEIPLPASVEMEVSALGGKPIFSREVWQMTSNKRVDNNVKVTLNVPDNAHVDDDRLAE